VIFTILFILWLEVPAVVLSYAIYANLINRYFKRGNALTKPQEYLWVSRCYVTLIKQYAQKLTTMIKMIAEPAAGVCFFLQNWKLVRFKKNFDSVGFFQFRFGLKPNRSHHYTHIISSPKTKVNISISHINHWISTASDRLDPIDFRVRAFLVVQRGRGEEEGAVLL